MGQTNLSIYVGENSSLVHFYNLSSESYNNHSSSNYTFPFVNNRNAQFQLEVFRLDIEYILTRWQLRPFWRVSHIFSVFDVQRPRFHRL